MFLGHARGRVGSVVFSRRMGKQITRTYNAEPANPKTRAQALQRAQFSTVIAASVGLKEVINNSFDGAKNGQESVNKFVSVNLSDLRKRSLEGESTANEWLVPKGSSFVQPQPWIISQGSLKEIWAGTRNLLLVDSKVYPDGWEGITDDELAAWTAAALKNVWAYEPGCQLTFVTIESVTQADGTERLQPVIDRIVFNNLAPNDSQTPLFYQDEKSDDTYVYISANFVDLTKTTLTVGKDNHGNKVVILPDYLVAPQGVTTKAGPLNLGDGYLGLGVITTVLRDGNYVHSKSHFSPNYDAYDYTEDAVSTYLAQSNARKVISSDYYTEQPETDNNDWEVPTLEEVVSAQISALGMKAKGVYVGQSNSYGPVAEGNPVFLVIDVPARFQIRANSVKAYNGETPLGNDWYITRSAARRVTITGPMPTTTSFPFNVSFEVDDTVSGSHVGLAALRINVSKANA